MEAERSQTPPPARILSALTTVPVYTYLVESAVVNSIFH